MKRLSTTFFLAALLAFASTFVSADAVYPYTKAVYVPTAISAPVTYSAPANYLFQTHNITTATVRVTGTCTGLVAAVQGTNDSANWTTLNAVAVGGGSSLRSLTAPGFWRINSGGFTQLRVNITTLTASCTVAMAGSTYASSAADLCSSPATQKSSAVVNVGASVSGLLVAAVAGRTVYLCSLAVSAGGTNPTMTIRTGTQTTNPCDTGASNLSGAIVPSATVGMANIGVGHTVVATAPGGQLCLLTGATTSIQGVATFVQQ